MKTKLLAVLASVCLFSGGAFAADAATPEGAESKGLEVMNGNFTFTGTAKPGAFGPDSPALTTVGTWKCKWLLGGKWLSCDIVDKAGSGKAAITWLGQIVMGWDAGEKSLRAIVIDNFGLFNRMKVVVEGKKVTLESLEPAMMGGQPTKFRLVYDMTDPKAGKFTDERSIADGAWVLIEDAVSKKGR